MSDMERKENQKYQAIARIITSPASPAEAEKYLADALASLLEALDISAASIVILNDQGRAIINVRQGRPELQNLLMSLEERMIGSMRSEFGLEHIYSTLNYGGEKSLFSYMIKAGKKTLGAVSGICEGSRNIALEEEFIKVVAAALENSFGASGKVENARAQAVRQTTVTLNHEINNPLTAVLGNVQLLLMQSEKLSPEVINRLQLIEKSSLRIRDVINQLLKIVEVKSTTYVEDTDMIDLDDSDENST